MKTTSIFAEEWPVVETHDIPGPADESVRKRLQELVTASAEGCKVTESPTATGSLRYELQMKAADEPDAGEIREAFHVILDAAVGLTPLNPKLPEGFNCTANEERSVAELAAWWDQPFVQGPEEGPYDIRCLDGGAWDRPTWYGRVDTLDEAPALAAAKLGRWRAYRSKPIASLDPGAPALVRPPQHPHAVNETLKKFNTLDDLVAYVKSQADQAAHDKPH